jgi:hypothetical protein
VLHDAVEMRQVNRDSGATRLLVTATSSSHVIVIDFRNF